MDWAVKNGWSNRGLIRLGSTLCAAKVVYETQICEFLAAFLLLASPPHHFSIMNTCKERRLGLCLVSCRTKVCIQSLRSEGLQCDVKRSIPRMAIASLRQHETPTLSERFWNGRFSFGTVENSIRHLMRAFSFGSALVPLVSVLISFLIIRW